MLNFISLSHTKLILTLLRANLGKPGGAELRGYIKQKVNTRVLRMHGIHPGNSKLFYMPVEPPKHQYMSIYSLVAFYF